VKLDLQTDRTLIRADERSTRYVAVSFTAPEAPRREERVPVNVALVLDRSGSMASEQKFGLARQAVEQALRMLRTDDRVALVVYDNQIDVLLESSHATSEAKERGRDALAGVEPRANTDLCGGWLRGCEQIAEHLRDHDVGRCLLLTDGLANTGETNPARILEHAAALRDRGVMTSTFGVGEDFDERLLRDMAHEGGGQFYFIGSPAQMPDLLTSELGEALEVVMRGAVLELALPPGARAEPLHRYRSRRIQDRNELRVELGEPADLPSEPEVDAELRCACAQHLEDRPPAGTSERSARGSPRRWPHRRRAACGGDRPTPQPVRHTGRLRS
jgi:Ca-activated chloride channel family protein